MIIEEKKREKENGYAELSDLKKPLILSSSNDVTLKLTSLTALL